MLLELSHMVVKFLLGWCSQIPPGHLVCGNSLQAKSVNLKKKNPQVFPTLPPFTTPYPATLVSFSIVLCFLSCLLIFLKKFIYAKKKYRLLCSSILSLGFWKRFRQKCHLL
jgi:hypothetical protein